LLPFFLLFLTITLYGQANKATIYGAITDATTEQSVEFVTVFVKGTNNGISSTAQGTYSIVVPADEAVTIVFSRIGYEELSTTITPTAAGKSRKVNVSMAPAESAVEIEVTESRLEEAGMIKEEVTELKLLPWILNIKDPTRFAPLSELVFWVPRPMSKEVLKQVKKIITKCVIC